MSSLTEPSVPLTCDKSQGFISEPLSKPHFSISLLGRFLKTTGNEYPCRIKDITPYTATLLSPSPVITGEKIVCFLDRIGILQGDVDQYTEDGFVLSLSLTAHGRRSLAGRLKKIQECKSLSDFRPLKEKFVTITARSDLSLGPSSSLQGRLQDLSLFGTFFITEARPPLGSELYLKNLRCRVDEHHENGIFLSFVDIKCPKAFRRHFLGQSSTL